MSGAVRASETRWRIGRGLDAATIAAWIRGDDADGSAGFALIVDEKVHEAHSTWLEALKRELGSCRIVAMVPSGEASKSVDLWARLQGDLIGAGIRRHDTVVAIGGGVTGDLGGFVAATLHRGMRLVHVPTTLLAIADSSIGGKTGINHPLGKNLIGAFHPASEIVVDTRLLTSLPLIEWINGFAEVIKYAYIEDPELFEPIRRVCRALDLESAPLSSPRTEASMTDQAVKADLEFLIDRSMRIKTGIVAEDEFEMGRRAILNFGHTFAHAVEQCAGYGTISHGSAVLIGMAAACHLSDPSSAEAATEPLLPFLLAIAPVLPEDLGHLRGAFDVNRLTDAMKRDKKNRSESIRFVLLDGIGRAEVREVSDAGRIRSAWNFAAALLTHDKGR